ncbi:GTP 3',8-cyclase MoaA, partial [Geobacillus stearothermophilus]|nr:GTP 3',8-cyclase MoaA [Geobacillus stearothermophilus]
VSLKDKLRAGAGKEELKALIAAIWSERTDRYSEERTAETAKQRPKIEMSYIGG